MTLMFTGGEQRATLSPLAYFALSAAPGVSLLFLIIFPNYKISRVTKQALSIPLLLTLFFIPFGFTSGHKSNSNAFALQYLAISY